MRRYAAIIGTTVLLAFAGVAAAATVSPPPPQIPRVPGAWSHVEMNVNIRHAPHTLILDRGRVVQVTTSQLVLREQGVNTPIPITAQTLVMIDGSKASITNLRRRMVATTMRIDGGAAVRVRATSF